MTKLSTCKFGSITRTLSGFPRRPYLIIPQSQYTTNQLKIERDIYAATRSARESAAKLLLSPRPQPPAQYGNEFVYHFSSPGTPPLITASGGLSISLSMYLKHPSNLSQTTIDAFVCKFIDINRQSNAVDRHLHVARLIQPCMLDGLQVSVSS